MASTKGQRCTKPRCGGETGVIDSRSFDGRIRRRRKCKKCGRRFTTLELECDVWDQMTIESLSELQIAAIRMYEAVDQFNGVRIKMIHKSRTKDRKGK